MRLLITHPSIATRNCEHCSQWQYNEETGKPYKRRGTFVKRQPGSRLCDMVGTNGEGTKCPKGKPGAGVSLCRANLQAYMHYLECKATGLFPDDPIVKRNAGMIHLVESSWQRQHTREQATSSEMVAAMLKVKRG